MGKFEIGYREADNCNCDICHGLNKVMTIKWYTQDFESDKQKGRICKTLQKHPHLIWICRDCWEDFQKACMDSAKKAYESGFTESGGKNRDFDR